MLDWSHAYETYEVDTEVEACVDVEAIIVQVHTHGSWHRRTPPDFSHTACGLTFRAMTSPLRRETLREPLCSVCFTDFELELAAEHTANQREPGDKP